MITGARGGARWPGDFEVVELDEGLEGVELAEGFEVVGVCFGGVGEWAGVVVLPVFGLLGPPGAATPPVVSRAWAAGAHNASANIAASANFGNEVRGRVIAARRAPPSNTAAVEMSR